MWYGAQLPGEDEQITGSAAAQQHSEALLALPAKKDHRPLLVVPVVE